MSLPWKLLLILSLSRCAPSPAHWWEAALEQKSRGAFSVAFKSLEHILEHPSLPRVPDLAEKALFERFELSVLLKMEPKKIERLFFEAERGVKTEATRRILFEKWLDWVYLHKPRKAFKEALASYGAFIKPRSAWVMDETREACLQRHQTACHDFLKQEAVKGERFHLGELSAFQRAKWKLNQAERDHDRQLALKVLKEFKIFASDEAASEVEQLEAYECQARAYEILGSPDAALEIYALIRTKGASWSLVDSKMSRLRERALQQPYSVRMALRDTSNMLEESKRIPYAPTSSAR